MISDQVLHLHRDQVRAEWVDEYDHMNLAYYVLVCDQATYEFWEMINNHQGIEHRQGAEYAVVETHVNYLAEVRLGAPLLVTTQLLEFDEKRFRIFHELHQTDRNFLAATNEVLALGFDLNKRGVMNFKPSVQQSLAKIHSKHKKLVVPRNAGRSIRILKR